MIDDHSPGLGSKFIVQFPFAITLALISQESDDFLQRSISTALRSAEMAVVDCIRDHDNVYTCLHQIVRDFVAVGGTRPEVALCCEHQSRGVDEGCVPQLPPRR